MSRHGSRADATDAERVSSSGMSRALRLFPALLAVGCVLTPVDLTGKRCPCDQPGWSCDLRGGEPGVCVRAPSLDGGACTPAESACNVLASPILCDGFEDETVSSDWDVTDFSEGTHGTTPEAARGCGGLDVRATSDPYRYYVSHWLPGAPYHSGELHVRTWIRLDPEMPIRDYVAALFLSEEDAPHDGVGFHVESGPAITLYAERASLEVYQRVDVAYGRWTCVEIHFEISTSGTVSLDVDGTERARFESVDLGAAGGYSLLGIGSLQHGVEEMESRISFDDVVVDDEPIGCL